MGFVTSEDLLRYRHQQGYPSDPPGDDNPRGGGGGGGGGGGRGGARGGAGGRRGRRDRKQCQRGSRAGVEREGVADRSPARRGVAAGRVVAELVGAEEGQVVGLAGLEVEALVAEATVDKLCHEIWSGTCLRDAD